MVLNKSTPVLLVDGEASSISLVSGLLKRARFETVETVEDADTALEFLTAREPRLIVAELDLEGTSGLQLLRTITSDNRLERSPFIVTTKGLTAAEAVAIKNAGADGLLLKPFRPDALITEMRGRSEHDRRRDVCQSPQLRDRSLWGPSAVGSNAT
jgi:two-component system, chemotaxis family, chemotaxis protein CheY